MSTGTKIGLVAILILTVVLAAVILDNDIEKAPSAKDQAAADRRVQQVNSNSGSSKRNMTNRNSAKRNPVRNKSAANKSTRQNRASEDSDRGNAVSNRNVDPNRKRTTNNSARNENNGRTLANKNNVGTNSGRDKTVGSGGVTRTNKNDVLRPMRPTDSSLNGSQPTSRKAVADSNKMKPAKTDNIGQPVPAVTHKEEPTRVAGANAKLGAETPSKSGTTKEKRDKSTDGFPRKYEVEDGDNLWKIARRFYGDPTVFEKIRAANPQLENGDFLTVGDEITLPVIRKKPRTVAKKTTAKRDKTSRDKNSYVIQEGDTLYDLAARFLGDANRWPEIQKANPGLDPDLILAGTRIRMPKK